MKITKSALVPCVIAVMTIAAAVSVFCMKIKYNTYDDLLDIRLEAEKLYYNDGDIDNAISRMEAYCAHAVTDIGAEALLGDWYMKAGNEKDAIAHYAESAARKKSGDGIIKPLGVKNTAEVIEEPIETFKLEIAPDVRMTKGMTLTVTSANIAPEKSEGGRIRGRESELDDDEGRYVTTEWFPVTPKGQYLTMSGGFNCAMWQFMDSDGEILTYAVSSNDYRRKNNSSENVYQMARVIIPDNAAQCRVTYFDSERERLTAENEELSIVYGRLIRKSESEKKTYEIPDLSEGEKITYENGSWLLTSGGQVSALDWDAPPIERGSYIEISGELLGAVSFEGTTLTEYKKDGIYTIRFDNSPSVAGSRLDDAANLSFNASGGGTMLNLGENDFDSIYPWSEMRLCAIDGEKIVYEGEKGFETDGSAGDVFVEIPKFYSRRFSDGEYETISISGAPHEGMGVDPAFLTANGETDRIYIAAYLTAIDDGEAVSAAGTVPDINISFEECVSAAEKKGFKEIDYAALSALQKLFMVETGLRNSQVMYLGECALNMPQEGLQNELAATAKEYGRKTNCITVSDKFNFKVGDSVVIYRVDDFDASLEKALREKRTVTAVVNNYDRTISVFFSGDPIFIFAGRSAAAQASAAAGGTDAGEYHTFAEDTARGTVEFKYRGIENLWGAADVFIDEITVNDGEVTITDRRGEKKVLSYNLPITDETAQQADMFAVKRMGFDALNPDIMLPGELGGGAGYSNYYGDAFHSKAGERVLTFGGRWDKKLSAGIFSYDASLARNEKAFGAAGRMMTSR